MGMGMCTALAWAWAWAWARSRCLAPDHVTVGGHMSAPLGAHVAEGHVLWSGGRREEGCLRMEGCAGRRPPCGAGAWFWPPEGAGRGV